MIQLCFFCDSVVFFCDSIVFLCFCLCSFSDSVVFFSNSVVCFWLCFLQKETSLTVSDTDSFEVCVSFVLKTLSQLCFL